MRFIISDIQRHIIPSFNKRWIQASRQKDAFLSKNSDWLDSEYCVPLPNSEEEITESTPSTSFEKCGRPCVSYGDSSESSKKRKNTMLLKEYGFEHIFNTYLQTLRSIGEEAEAKLVESLRIADKDKKNLISSFMENASQKNIPTDEEALSVFIDLDLTKAQYLYMRKVTNERNCSIFPPYCKIQGIKQTCYPPSSAIEITNTCENSGASRFIGSQCS